MVGTGAGAAACFYGVRGSTPVSGLEYSRYGGNTSCVALERTDDRGELLSPIIFDLGTGLRPFGVELSARAAGAFHGSVLLTHLHWDHIQGLPFFAPLNDPEATVDIYGPRLAAGPLAQVFEGCMRPPYFPITPAGLGGAARFHDCAVDHFTVDDAKVRSRWVRHTDPTLGYRVDWNDASVAYVSDHGPGTDLDHDDDYVPSEVLELADNVDLLIHDSQHTCAEYETKRHYGHSTIDYAVHVARVSGAKRLALFHHCPTHSDDELDAILTYARDLAARVGGPEQVVAAYEGLRVQLGNTELGTGGQE